MIYNAKGYEIFPLMATIDAQTIGTTAITSDIVKMDNFNNAVVLVSAGAVADTITVTVFRADNTTPSNTAAIKTQNITGSDDNKQYWFDIDVAKDLTDAYPYLAVKVVAADTNANVADAKIFGFNARYVPQTDLASVNVVTI